MHGARCAACTAAEHAIVERQHHARRGAFEGHARANGRRAVLTVSISTRRARVRAATRVSGPTKQPSACDDPNGVDDYARRIFEEINSIACDAGLINEATFNNALTQGLSGVLIEVSSYNGQKDDGEVTVTVYGSQGFDGFPTTHPALDGGDHWVLDPSSATGQFSTTNAYVSNFTLVASLTFPIVVGSTYTQSVTIQLDNGLIRADLQMNGNTLTKMTGVLGGRWDPAKFLPSLQAVPDPLSAGSYLCGNDFTYAFLKQTICDNVDLNISPSQDGQGICNAVSMGAAFEAVPAVLGKTGAVIDAAAPCGANYKDQCP